VRCQSEKVLTGSNGDDGIQLHRTMAALGFELGKSEKVLTGSNGDGGIQFHWTMAALGFGLGRGWWRQRRGGSAFYGIGF
jgi:hypothetical protein